MGILRLLVIFALILAQFLGLSEGAYSWEEGVSQCWSTNEVRYKNKLSNVDGDPWICQPEKGTGPRKCIKIRFDGNHTAKLISNQTVENFRKIPGFSAIF